ncbi:Extracellular exo-alpha-(1-5)-L-arabinofuranosidase [Colletotrichum sp. SAR 10_66]|nr:Extracellular exo-alpha-(1->5)-L-arabinofuranosidase [Colletotrichum sp. SAR 10_76]KAJ4998616.1 Extracellular exo-alpha-(1-5)-L-arabinofuranosidase [Colletotrichum sp. SAR 10_66]
MLNLLAISFQRQSAAVFLALCAFLLFADCTSAVKIRDGADPTVMKIGDTYYSAESAGGIYVRAASSLEGLGASDVRRELVWSDTNNMGAIWAPEITTDLGRTYIHFSAGVDAAHRMYVISADSPLGEYSAETKLALPDDQWAIDGTFFVFEGLGYFVWSGWKSEAENSEQNLYICRMDSPSQPIGQRYIISQPRESWEQGDSPLINEGPEAIVDPNGQLHIVYSANGSWNNKYCLADLRLRKGGDPTYVWDWYKSNGCLFGSHQDRMMNGWDATLYIDGPGHHTFALPNGDVNDSPGGTSRIPFVFHGVEKGTTYSWDNRDWFTGSYVWWSNTAYTRANVPGDTSNTGYSFKFFE